MYECSVHGEHKKQRANDPLFILHDCTLYIKHCDQLNIYYKHPNDVTTY